MFFPKLRRRAKWVFLFLAIAFAIGFVAFGVGTGVSGSSLGDVVQDLLNRPSATGSESLDDARERALANPRDASAQLAYANAFQSRGLTREAIVGLQRYTELRPKDVDALRQLALLWGSEGTRARQEAEAASAEAQQATLVQTLSTPNSPFFQEIARNEITNSIVEPANQRASRAQQRVLNAARREAAAYQQLVKLVPDDPRLFLQLGIASQTSGNNAAAIDAYERFLELAPDDSRAAAVRQQIELLEGSGSG